MKTNNDLIIKCKKCGSKNRIPAEKVGKPARCGECHSPIEADEKTDENHTYYFLRCNVCGAKNRISPAKTQNSAKCGKCGSSLRVDVLFDEKPITVTDSNLDSEVMHSPLPFLLFAWAPWCPTCRSYLPVIDEVAKDSKGKARVGKVNVEENPMISAKFSILSVPQLFIFDNGQMKENIPGAMKKHDIMMRTASYL